VIAPAPTAVLLVTCPDRRGLVAGVSQFVLRHGGNIVDADQHADAESGTFFQRVELELEGLDLDRGQLEGAFLAEVAEPLGMSAEVRFSDEVARLAILASKEPHCLYDLLSRWRAGELAAEVAVVLSNHPDHADVSAFFGVPYHHLPTTPEARPAQEAAVLDVLEEHRIDLVVLARYMQVLGDAVVERHRSRIINIHHSFLPAFVGARPYHQAHARGVKIIGVTAHYVTPELDQGPIIEQDVVRVTHRDGIADMVRKGRDLEKTVLARAVRHHLGHRVIVDGRRTVVFGG